MNNGPVSEPPKKPMHRGESAAEQLLGYSSGSRLGQLLQDQHNSMILGSRPACCYMHCVITWKSSAKCGTCGTDGLTC